MNTRAERKMPCLCPVDDKLFRPLGGRRVAVGGGPVHGGEIDLVFNGARGGEGMPCSKGLILAEGCGVQDRIDPVPAHKYAREFRNADVVTDDR
mgnify:CR=1 FL=1